MAYADEVLFEYVSRGNPKSNEHFKRFLRLYPQCREEIIDFTATWRAMSILERVLPPPRVDPEFERQMMKRAKARLRSWHRRRVAW